MSSTSTILLDFDGVVINNANISKYITHQSNVFIQKKYNKTYDKAKVLNKKMYTTHGHTAIGLDVKNPAQHVLDYNEFIFQNMDYTLIHNLLTKEDVTNLNYLVDYPETFGLLTNAPISWCENICMLANVDMYSIFEHDQCFGSDTGLIKPQKAIFDYVESNIDNKKKLHFIDDNKMNFKELCNNERWISHWMNNEEFFSLYDYLVETFH
ncbi:hypothetical protein QKU58_gp085 [Pyramimonas orientalis virus]|uniref:Uncharacterized protein n=1 Tax=Pyramimonas orientalis virus 01B TaxID=3134525 RepID=A0A7M3UNI7_9VIRU|nr:hypothetical protein QKU58_gp085 [Pyramimonas orientalis virus]QOI90246.1 hypothetical protein HWQ62_00109 [Pyramimonas orientalis virus]